MANQYPTWPYFKEITITDSPGTGYSVTLTVNYEIGMNTDFSDLRFSDTAATIPYFIVSKTDGVSAVVDIKTTAETTIYKHWGNAAATSESNADDVYLLYDNFTGLENAHPDDSKWTCEYGGSNGTIQLNGSGAVNITPPNAAGCAALISTQTFSQGISIICNEKISNTYYPDTLLGSGNLQKGAGGAGDWWHPSLGEGISFYVQSGLSVSSTDTKIQNTHPSTGSDAIGTFAERAYDALDTYYAHTYIWAASNIKLVKASTDSITSTTDITGTYRVAFSQGKAAIDGNGGTRTIDYVIVKKYTTLTPTFSEGETQTADATPIASFTAVNVLSVAFTDTSANTPTSWDWDFGDLSEHSTDQNPTHVYAAEGTYTVTLTATNATGSDEYIYEVSVSESGYTTIVYMRIHEMDHKVGATQKHSFQIAGSDGSGFKSTCTDPVISCSVNGADETNPSWTISAFNATMNRFSLEVVDPGTWDAGDNVDINISCDEGEGYLALNIVLDPAAIAVDTTELATAVSLADAAGGITAIKAITDLLTADPLAAINAEVDTAISDAGLVTKIDTVDTVVDGIATTLATPANFMADVSSLATSAEITALSNIAAVGAEKIVPAANYQFNVTAKTITFSGTFASLTVEQIRKIKNLTTNYIIYDSEDSNYEELSISMIGAVLTYTAAAPGATNDDILQIIVNQATV